MDSERRPIALRGRRISWEANRWLLSIQIEFSLGTTCKQGGKEGRCVSHLRESQSKVSVRSVFSMSEVHLKIFYKPSELPWFVRPSVDATCCFPELSLGYFLSG